jgi:F-type H+-transporting ATPase subunit gamma
MANLKQIKSKIKSVSNLKKITRALEVVSTVKLQKTKTQAENLKDYLADLLALVASVWGVDNLLTPPATTSTKTLCIVCSSERGLCGALNTRLFRKVLQDMTGTGTDADVFVLGKKWLEFFKRTKLPIVWALHLGDSYSENNLLPLYALLDEAMQSGKYAEVRLYFNYFKNVITQLPASIQLSPLSAQTFATFCEDVALDYGIALGAPGKELLVEPSRDVYLTELKRQVRNYILASAILQNKTGEHAARMIAMKNAKDNSIAFIKQLTLAYNKARQGAITQEISEIVSAKIAIEG